MLKLLIKLSFLSLGLSGVMCTAASSQSQLADLNERMSQMLNALYASPLLSKSPSALKSAEEVSTSTPPETSYIITSGPPQVVYVSPSSYLEAGAQSNDYGYSAETHPVTRSAWPYSYEYAYPQYNPPVFPARPYLEVPKYPQIPSPNYSLLPSPFPAPAAYSPLSYSGPIPTPSPVPPPVYPAPFPSPMPYPSMYPAVLQVPYSPTSIPQAYTPCSSPYPVGYPASMPSTYPAPALPPQYPPGFPSPALPSSPYSLGSQYSAPGFPSGLAPSVYPGFSSGLPSSFPSLGYPSPGYPSSMYAPPQFPPPAYPKYSEVLHHPFDMKK